VIFGTGYTRSACAAEQCRDNRVPGVRCFALDSPMGGAEDVSDCTSFRRHRIFAAINLREQPWSSDAVLPVA
jgi:hypothetical protein